MAALFQSTKKKREFDWLGAALGFFNHNAGQAYRKNRDEREEEEAARAEQAAMAAQLRNSLAREGLPDHVITGIMSDPKKVSEYLFEKYKHRQGGAEGFTVGAIDPRTGKIKSQTTPGWHDGSYFGGSDGTQAPRVIHEGTKMLPVVPGGQVFGYGAVTGRPIAPGAAGQMPGMRDPLAPLPELTDEDIARMRGGAGRGGPQTFPRPVQSPWPGY